MGEQPSRTAEVLKVSRPRVTQMRRQVADHVRETWRADPLKLATGVPQWQRDIEAALERRACRSERLGLDR
ncbi:MAG: hypothetical protein ACI96M_000389 [Candidatus Azotimanducaceae bacterium]|jgi:hypothetical protein